MTIIEVLVCRADGMQEIERREVPDSYFPCEPDAGDGEEVK